MKERRSPYGKQQDRELRVIEKVVKMSDEKLLRLQKNKLIMGCVLATSFTCLSLGNQTKIGMTSSLQYKYT